MDKMAILDASQSDLPGTARQGCERQPAVRAKWPWTAFFVCKMHKCMLYYYEKEKQNCQFCCILKICKNQVIRPFYFIR